VRAATDFELSAADMVSVTEPPTAEELCLLSEEVDPHRYIIGR
jgi:hypothetical protein